MKLASVRHPGTPRAERALLDAWYFRLLRARERLWMLGRAPGDSELREVNRAIGELQRGQEVEIPDGWVAAWLARQERS